ncbi:ceramide synthase isoform X2 [Dunckerocampus dactyliophorus]|uniref:ceramide synthase isoform X2 n=1 Tax=Dunckerocampus dactyliophorus TaxID=161453 RepID=UPI0024069999|nr:ceramide synthase isoform X2 [Dunckerocampus dactyliophorus]
MLQVLACGAVVFPGLFFAFRRILPRVFTHWSDADVVLVSERLVSSIHAVMATTAGIIVVSSCRGNVIHSRHWLATYFVIRYGVPYMAYDLLAMYLSHYHRFRVKGHKEYMQHSLQTVNSFVRRELLLVLHHIALLTVLLPVTLKKEHTIQVRQMCVDLHKSGNGYKKIATHLHLPISTDRGIINKFKTTGSVVNKPGRGRKCYFATTLRRVVRELKKCSKAHCSRIATNGSILGSQSLQNDHQVLST